MWRETVRRRGSLRAIFQPGLLRLTVPLTIMNAFTLFGWWGFNLWLPGYLSLPESAGGRGFSATTMSAFVIAMQAGMWLGYVTFGFISDRVGRKRTYVTYTCTAAILISRASRFAVRILLLLGPLVAFFATGYFSGFGAVTAEVYPTEIRASAQGFTYNMGRVTSALAPFVVGSLAQNNGFQAALSLTSAAFLLAAVTWIWIPKRAAGLSSEWSLRPAAPGMHAIQWVKRLDAPAEVKALRCSKAPSQLS